MILLIRRAVSQFFPVIWKCIPAILVLGGLLPLPAQAIGNEPPYVLEILKHSQTLNVLRGDHVERTFYVSVGRGGDGDKRKLGDKLTPTGVYRIVDFNDESRFYLFMHLNYPNIKDAFLGYRNNIIDQQDFDRIVKALRAGATPPQDTPLGGAIGIHGLGEIDDGMLDIHRNMNWTEGCIALTNSEVDELRKYVRVGTRVVIRD